MINYGYDAPKDSMIKINIQTSINTDLKDNNFKKIKSYTPQQVTDTNYNKSQNKKTNTIKVTNWSIKIK